MMNIKGYLKAYPTLRPSLELKRKVLGHADAPRPSLPMYLSHALPALSLALFIAGVGLGGGLYLGSRTMARQSIASEPAMANVYLARLPR